MTLGDRIAQSAVIVALGASVAVGSLWSLARVLGFILKR